MKWEETELEYGARSALFLSPLITRGEANESGQTGDATSRKSKEKYEKARTRTKREKKKPTQTKK